MRGIKLFSLLFVAVSAAAAVAVWQPAQSEASRAQKILVDKDVPVHVIAGTSNPEGPFSDNQNAVPGRSIACIGNGASGARVLVIYAYKQGQPNRSNELKAYFKNMAKRVNGVFYQSTVGGAPNQKVRFATTPGCELKVKTLKLTGNITGSSGDFGAVVDQVKAAGYTNANRKYLVELDLAPETDFLCGQALIYGDDSLSSNNNNNKGYPGYAVVGGQCWNSAEAHEIAHMLGAVQLSSPRTTGAWHCNDDHDIMCYSDGGPTSDLQVVCPIEQNWFLDCNNDDYYNNNQGYRVVRPAPGYEASYLENHWNIALSRYLTNPADYPVWAQ